jgi:hypothetical protein
VSFEDDFVEIAGLLGIETTQAEVVDDEHVGGKQTTQCTSSAEFGIEGLISKRHIGSVYAAMPLVGSLACGWQGFRV